MKTTKNHLVFVSVVLAMLVTMVLLFIALESTKPLTASAGGYVVTPYKSYATSSSILVATSNTQAVATNTARLGLRITNISSKPIYCNLKNGAPASMYSGMAILASTTKEWKIDEDPYTGSVNCISEASASTTVLEW